MEQQTYIAKCYILWGPYHREMWATPTERRVYCEGKAKTICVEMEGIDRAEALSKLKTNAYEFIQWWS